WCVLVFVCFCFGLCCGGCGGGWGLWLWGGWGGAAAGIITGSVVLVEGGAWVFCAASFVGYSPPGILCDSHR
ncbi:hypothetical protein PUR61_00315, partial [Streptomyces sp. BE20]|uniref:hypothetical protein n=1 Tax=Streptomyces sp. BE20 TaxID=3002525 RepID=UPI002E7A724B